MIGLDDETTSNDVYIASFARPSDGQCFLFNLSIVFLSRSNSDSQNQWVAMYFFFCSKTNPSPFRPASTFNFVSRSTS